MAATESAGSRVKDSGGLATGSLDVDRLDVLIVEDEALVALELETAVRLAGHHPVGRAITAGTALRQAAGLRPDLAIVDIHLADGPTGLEAARSIAAVAEAEILFTTADPNRIPADFAGACGVVIKPFTGFGMSEAIGWIAGRIRRGPATQPPPGALRLAPDFERRWRRRQRDEPR